MKKTQKLGANTTNLIQTPTTTQIYSYKYLYGGRKVFGIFICSGERETKSKNNIIQKHKKHEVQCNEIDSYMHNNIYLRHLYGRGGMLRIPTHGENEEKKKNYNENNAPRLIGTQTIGVKTSRPAIVYMDFVHLSPTE